MEISRKIAKGNVTESLKWINGLVKSSEQSVDSNCFIMELAKEKTDSDLHTQVRTQKFKY